MAKPDKKDEPKTISWEEVKDKIIQDTADFTVLAEANDAFGTSHRFAVSFGVDGRVHDFHTITDDDMILYRKRPTFVLGENESVPASGFYDYSGPCITLRQDADLEYDLYNTSLQKIITGNDDSRLTINEKEYSVVHMTGAEYKAVFSDAIRRMDDLLPDLTYDDFDDKRRAKEFETEVCLYLSQAVNNYQQAMALENNAQPFTEEERQTFTGRRAEISRAILTDDHALENGIGAHHSDTPYVYNTEVHVADLFDKYADTQIAKANSILLSSSASVIERNAAVELKLISEHRKFYDDYCHREIGQRGHITAHELGLSDEVGRGSFAGLRELQKKRKEVQSELFQEMKPFDDEMAKVKSALNSINVTTDFQNFDVGFNVAKETSAAIKHFIEIQQAFRDTGNNFNEDTVQTLSDAIKKTGGTCDIEQLYQDLDKVSQVLRCLNIDTPTERLTSDFTLADGWDTALRQYAAFINATNEPEKLFEIYPESSFMQLKQGLDIAEERMKAIGMTVPEQRFNHDMTITDEWKTALERYHAIQDAAISLANNPSEHNAETLVSALEDAQINSHTRMWGRGNPSSMLIQTIRFSEDFEPYIDNKVNEYGPPAIGTWSKEKADTIVSLIGLPDAIEGLNVSSDIAQSGLQLLSNARDILTDMPVDLYSQSVTLACPGAMKISHCEPISIDTILNDAETAAQDYKILAQAISNGVSVDRILDTADKIEHQSHAFRDTEISIEQLATQDGAEEFGEHIRHVAQKVYDVNKLESIHPALLDRDTFRSIQHINYNALSEVDESIPDIPEGYITDETMKQIAYDTNYPTCMKAELAEHHAVHLPLDGMATYGGFSATEYYDRMQIRSAVVAILQEEGYGRKFADAVSHEADIHQNPDKIRIAQDFMRERLIQFRDNPFNDAPPKNWTDKMVESYLVSNEFIEIAKNPSMPFEERNGNTQPRAQFKIDWNSRNFDDCLTETDVREMRQQIHAAQDDFRMQHGYPSMELKNQDNFLLDVLANNAVTKRLGYEQIISRGMDSVPENMPDLSLKECIIKQATVVSSQEHAGLTAYGQVYGSPTQVLTEPEKKMYDQEMARLTALTDKLGKATISVAEIQKLKDSGMVKADFEPTERMMLRDLSTHFSSPEYSLDSVNSLHMIRDAMERRTEGRMCINEIFFNVWQVKMEYVDRNMQDLLKFEQLSQFQYKLALGQCENIANAISLDTSCHVDPERIMKQVQALDYINVQSTKDITVEEGTAASADTEEILRK